MLTHSGSPVSAQGPQAQLHPCAAAQHAILLLCAQSPGLSVGHGAAAPRSWVPAGASPEPRSSAAPLGAGGNTGAEEVEEPSELGEVTAPAQECHRGKLVIIK